jgi:hypothetical protein
MHIHRIRVAEFIQQSCLLKNRATALTRRYFKRMQDAAAAINALCSWLNADFPRAGGLDVIKKLSFDESKSCTAESAVVSVSSV